MKEITIFGWKREYLPKMLKECEKLSAKIANHDIMIVTGGGGGFMESGNKGAFEVNQELSKGIILPFLDENRNIYMLEKNVIVAENFAERKKYLIENKEAFIFFPGGMGTQDEFTEVLNLYKTKEISLKNQKPIYLYGKDYWCNLCKWFLKNTKSWPFDKITMITDDIDEIYDDLKNKNIL